MSSRALALVAVGFWLTLAIASSVSVQVNLWILINPWVIILGLLMSSLLCVLFMLASVKELIKAIKDIENEGNKNNENKG